MHHAARSIRPALATALAACLISLAAPAPTATADQPDGYGPMHPFDDSIMPNDGPQPKVRNQGLVLRTDYGYRLILSSQSSRLRVTLTDAGRLRLRDTRTRSWKRLPGSCARKRVDRGIAATCGVPADTSTEDPLLVEVRPRLGNDRVDGRGLPARVEMAVLGDAGRDTLFGGGGNDYLGGATDRDYAHGGPGKDWIRGGEGNDRLYGGPQGDAIVGLAGRDVIRGGGGKDRVTQ